MISNQALQNTIDGLKTISRVELCVFGTDGEVLASTFASAEEHAEAVVLFISSPAESQTVAGAQFFKVFDNGLLEVVVLAKGDTESVYMVGKMTAFQIQSLIVAYKERFDRDNFIKNLLLDNMLQVDIRNFAKKLHIETEAKRVVLLIETQQERDFTVMETVYSLYAGANNDFITAVDETSIIIVRELRKGDTYDTLTKLAEVLLDTLNTEAMARVSIAIGTIVNELRDVSRSYKEAKMALEVGKIFYSDRKVVAYSNLGIGRLVYQLPVQMCKVFIREIFNGNSPDDLDEETVVTINKFFENNLNVSETSRQLFIHRNTLVYRLDKLLRMTNLDIRQFDDAITFKMALMVVEYMKYMENNDF